MPKLMGNRITAVTVGDLDPVVHVNLCFLKFQLAQYEADLYIAITV